MNKRFLLTNKGGKTYLYILVAIRTGCQDTQAGNRVLTQLLTVLGNRLASLTSEYNSMFQ